MHRVVFVLACLACVGYARQPQASDEDLTLTGEELERMQINEAIEKAMQVRKRNPGKALLNLLGGLLLSPFRIIKNIITFPFWLVRRLTRKNIKKLAKKLIQEVQELGLEPSSMEFLSDAIARGGYTRIGEGIYAMTIDLTLDYDANENYNPESGESPYTLTKVDYKKTDDPIVRDKVMYLWQYGLQMVERRFLPENSFYNIFETRVVNRMGMEPEDFIAKYEEWLADLIANSEE